MEAAMWLRSCGTPEMEKLLSESAKLIDRHGPDSKKVADFLAKHKKNMEFIKLAELSKILKRALGA
jgi:hypothetical protein